MKDKRLWILLLTSLFLLVLPNGLYTAFDKDEPKYLEAAREMLLKEDYVTPYYNYDYRFDKPILVYWLILAGYKVLGVSEFAGRLFVSLFGVLTVLLLYFWLSRERSKDFAFWSSLVLLSLLDFIVMSSVAMPDIVLTFFISATLISFYEGNKTKNRNFYLLSFLFSGLATLTKGPVGIVLPAFILFIYLILKRNLTETLKEIPWKGGILILLAVILPWYGAVLYKNGYQFFKDFILFHNFHRFFSKVPGHPTEWWYYFANYFWLYLPFSVFFLFELIKGWKEKVFFTDNLLLFSFCWFFGVFLFFQVAHTKLAHYLLPSFPPFAVIVTHFLLKEKSPLPAILTLALISFLFLGGIAFFLYKGWNLLGATFLIPPLLGAVYSLVKRDYLKPLTASFIAGMVLFKWVTLPLLQPLRAKPIIGEELRKIKERCPSCKVFFLSYESPEIVYKFRGKEKLKDIGFKEAEKLLKGKDKVFFVTRENRLKKIKAPYEVIEKRKELITNHSIVIITNRKGEKNEQG